MHIPRNRLTVATGLALIMLVLTACTGDGSAQNQQTGATAGPPQVSETFANPTVQPTTPATPTSVVTSAGPTALPQFGRLQAPSAYHAGTAPASQNLNGTVNVEAYLQTVMRSNRDVWRATFGANGLQAPSLTYDITSRSDRYVSACTKGGQAIVVTAAYGRLFYCSEDNKPDGAIALPVDVIAGIWKKTDRKVADLAAAITASRTSGLTLTASLQRQLNLPVPEPTSRQYVATCLAGVWAHSVYAQNAFTEKELAVALEHAYHISSEVDGTVTWTDPTDLLITTWMAGFRSGKLGGCGTSYWR